MTNPNRGEVELKADGESYTLRFTSNAIAKLEHRMELPITQIGKRLENPEGAWINDLICVLWAGLWHNHRDLSEEDAGDILDDAGYQATMDAIGEAFRLAFPAQEAGDKARPRKARRPARSTS